MPAPAVCQVRPASVLLTILGIALRGEDDPGVAWVERNRVGVSDCDRSPVGASVAAFEEAELPGARVDGLWPFRVDRERGDRREAETGVCRAPVDGAVAALVDAPPGVDGVDGLRRAGGEREGRVLALGVADGVRGTPAATAVAAPEDAQATGRRIDRLRVERVDEERGHPPDAAVTPVAAHRRCSRRANCVRRRGS